ncbi:MAG: helicase-exonuclease AddAB subunit AddA [Eubacteriales bacterium]|nr:helicase-exonuclease AddAB subunit AddA [Eubacteriales bacterium]
MGVNWTEEQKSAIDNRGGTLLVSAAAGSGKTAVLVQRVLERVTDPENPCDIDSFLIVTFTRAAASEMRGKIADALAALAAKNPQNLRLRRQLMLVHRAQITTVHAFCMGLLREHFHTLGLPPTFRTAEESEQAAMQAEVLEDVLEAQYARDDAGFAALVDALNGGRDDRQLSKVILETFANLQSSPKPKQVLENYKRQFIRPFDRLADTAWGRELLGAAKDRLAYGIAFLHRALDDMQGTDVVQQAYGPVFLDDLCQAQDILALVEDGCWDEAVRQCLAVRANRKRIPTVRNYEDKAFLKRLQSDRAVWKTVSDDLADNVLCASEDDVRADMLLMAPAVGALCDTVQAFMDAYQAEKLRRGVVDFNDLEHFAVELLTDADGKPTPLAREMHFSEIMVDEYQDTNAVQDAIFRAVSDDENNIFMVGDVKQSIYRFRLANPDIFLQKYQSYSDAEAVMDDSPRRIVLSRNFRSRPQVLDSVNYLFAALMSERLGDLDYTEREALHAGARFPEGKDDYRTEFCVLETKSEEEDAPESIQQEAAYCAARIRAMLDDGFQVTDKQSGDLRPCRPEDFAILMRSVKNKAPVFQRELMALGIPAGADAPENMLDTPELLTLIAWLEMVDNPRQDIPLLAAMNSPIGGFDEQELAEIRLYDRDNAYYCALQAAAEQNPKAADFLAQLQELRLLAVDLPVRQLLWHIVDRTGAMGIFGAMPNGRMRQQHITAFMELADSFELSGSRGLFAFVRHLRELRETETAVTAAENEHTGGMVRIMTIHKSKGLEFPIVIVANCTKRFNEQDLTRAVLLHERMGISMRCRDSARGLQYDGLDRRAMASLLRREMVSEELRILYVALTRAKEKLICIAAMKDVQKQVEKWASIAALDPIPPYALSGANQYALWLGVPLLRHPSAIALRELCAQPPAPAPGAPDCFIVRLIPYRRAEDWEAQPERGHVAQPRHMEAPVLKPYAADVLRDLPSKLTATAVAESFRAAEAQEETAPPKQESSLRRPFFEREARGLTPSEAGTAHHLFLQFCDFARCESDEGRRAELERLRRKRILSDTQADAIRLEHIAAFFGSELYQRIRTAEQVRREWKFSILVPAKDYYPEAADFAEENVLMQGVIDCLVETEDGLLIIDFKTDRVKRQWAAKRAEQYRGQLAAYCRAAHTVFGKPVAGCALFFLHCGATIWMD